MQLRRYETLLLTMPDLPPEDAQGLRQKFLDIIERMKGNILKVDDWGRRRLAYPVQKQLHGHYVLLDYVGTPEILAEVERNMSIDERIWKYLTLIIDKKFSQEKYEKEQERVKTETARREAEMAQREAYMDADGDDDSRPRRSRNDFHASEDDRGGMDDESEDD